MYVPSKGLTKVDAAFNYTLKVKSITPNIGYYCYKKIINNSDRINLYFNISFKSGKYRKHRCIKSSTSGHNTNTTKFKKSFFTIFLLAYFTGFKTYT